MMSKPQAERIVFFSFRGVSIGFHRTFLLVGFFLLWWDGALAQKLLYFGMLFASILIHEIAHAAAGCLLGLKPRSIMLSFWGGFTEFQQPIPINGVGAFVALAGPIANVLLIVCAAIGAIEVCSNGSILAWMHYFAYNFFDLDMTKVSLPVGINVWYCGDYIVGIPVEKWEALQYFSLLAVINGILAVFNLAPAFPLDGGRIFRSLSAYVIGKKNAALAMLWVGRGLAVAFACWCLYDDLYRDHDVFGCALGCYVAFVIWQGCYGEYARTKIFVGAELGDPESECVVGMFYLNGLTVAQDVNAGVNWILKSAEHGYAYAQNLMALAYATGDGVEKDATRAFDFAARASNQELPEAICTLGNFYNDGIGCERSPEAAARLYLKAAELNNAEGMFRAALCLLSGESVAQDVSRAQGLLENAFEQGSIPAAVELSLLYEYGLLMSEDGKVPERYIDFINKGGQEATTMYASRHELFESVFGNEAKGAQTEQEEE